MGDETHGITMRGSAYGIHRETNLDFEEADKRVRDALTAEGFGVLTEIDVSATLKKKLDVDFPKYRILGACNPALARDALGAEPDIGLLLPCNVVVYARPDGSAGLSAMDPAVAFEKLVETESVHAIAADVKARLTRALDSVANG